MDRSINRKTSILSICIVNMGCVFSPDGISLTHIKNNGRYTLNFGLESLADYEANLQWMEYQAAKYEISKMRE